MLESPRSTSATIVFNLPGSHIWLHLESRASPEHVRLALRKACSHRRSIVADRPAFFISNAIMHLAKQSQDIVATFAGHDSPASFRDATLRNTWFYKIELGYEGKKLDAPIITWGEKDQTPRTEFLFPFLGNEWKRPYKTGLRPYAGKRRGRKSSLRSQHAELFQKQTDSKPIDTNNKQPNYLNWRVSRGSHSRSYRINFKYSPSLEEVHNEGLDEQALIDHDQNAAGLIDIESKGKRYLT